MENEDFHDHSHSSNLKDNYLPSVVLYLMKLVVNLLYNVFPFVQFFLRPRVNYLSFSFA